MRMFPSVVEKSHCGNNESHLQGYNNYDCKSIEHVHLHYARKKGYSLNDVVNLDDIASDLDEARAIAKRNVESNLFVFKA